MGCELLGNCTGIVEWIGGFYNCSNGTESALELVN